MNQPTPGDTPIQVAVGLADTPHGQRLAISLTLILGKDGALTLAEGIKQTAAAMSSTRLVIPAPGSNGITDAVDQHPS